MSSESICEYPCIAVVPGPTMCGKTHLLANLLVNDLKNKKPRARLPNGEGLPKRIVLVCEFDRENNPSIDKGHGDNLIKLERIFPGIEVVSIARIRQEQMDEADDVYGSNDYRDVDDIGTSNSLFSLICKKLTSKDFLQKGDLVIFDDMQVYFRASTPKDCQYLETLLQQWAHHKGISCFCLLQSLPSGRMLDNLRNQAMYFIFPTFKGLSLELIRRTVMGSRANYADIVPKEANLNQFDGLIFDKTGKLTAIKQSPTGGISNIQTLNDGNSGEPINKQQQRGQPNAGYIRGRGDKFDGKRGGNGGKISKKETKKDVQASQPGKPYGKKYTNGLPRTNPKDGKRRAKPFL